MRRKISPSTFHVVGASCNSSWPLSQSHSWAIFCRVIDRLQKNNSLITYAFVLMSNHYHWICSYDGPNSQFFEEFQEQVRSEFLNDSFFGNAIFDAPPEAFPLNNIASFRNTLRYAYRNPVSAGLVFQAEDYAYSTLHFILGKKPLPFRCQDNLKTIYDPIRVLSWINDPNSKSLYFQINHHEPALTNSPASRFND